MKPIKLGILGVGNHFERRLQVPLRNHSSVKLVAIGSRNPEKARTAAEKWGFEKSWASYREVVDDPDVEAVYIPLPNNCHAEWIKKCADVGKPVLCEKSLTLNAPEAIEALEYAERKGIFVMESFMYKFHPQWLKARELISIGDIGSVLTIQTVFSYHNTDADNIRNKPDTGGGAMLDIGCYAISSARYLLNDEPTRVSASVHYDPDMGIDTFVNTIMKFGNDSGSPCAQLTVCTRMKGQQRVAVYGSKGSLVIHRPFNSYPDVPLMVTVDDGDGPRDILFEPADQYDLLFKAFAEACRGSTIPEFASHADAIGNMKAIDAVFRAGKSGQWEKV